MRVKALFLSAALVASFCTACEWSDPQGEPPPLEIAGEWSASLARHGEFSSVDLKLYLIQEGDAYTGQLQRYHDRELDDEVRLTVVRVDTTGLVEFRFEGEDQAHVTLELSADRKTLSGTILYDEGDSGMEAITLTRTGNAKLCDGACLGGFCDLGAGQCVSCGDGVECDAECTANEQCPYSSQACAPEGLCRQACRGADECAPWQGCADGFCVWEG